MPSHEKSPSPDSGATARVAHYQKASRAHQLGTAFLLAFLRRDAEGMQFLAAEAAADPLSFGVSLAVHIERVMPSADVRHTFIHLLESQAALSADLAADPAAPDRIARFLERTGCRSDRFDPC